MSWFSRLKHKFWRKRIYKTVVKTAKVCLGCYYTFSLKFPDVANVELYKMVLVSRNYTEEAIEDIVTEAKTLRDVVHLIAMGELPWELDHFVQTPLKSKFDDIAEDEPKLVETYRSLYEIVYSVIPEGL